MSARPSRFRSPQATVPSHDVHVTILIQVDYRRVDRHVQVVAKGPLLPHSVGCLVVRQNAVSARITGDNVARAITIQVDDRDVRDPHGVMIWADRYLVEHDVG